jgi:hypothetical protein
VHVGAADAGLLDADQNVVDPDRRLRDVFQPKPRFSALLN